MTFSRRVSLRAFLQRYAPIRGCIQAVERAVMQWRRRGPIALARIFISAVRQVGRRVFQAVE
jgi:hypothetical protein